MDGSHSELPASARLAAGLLKVYVDDAPFYASPVLDSDGFWITSVLPGNSLGLKDVSGNKRAATAEFTLPYRLSGHTMEVEINPALNAV